MFNFVLYIFFNGYNKLFFSKYEMLLHNNKELKYVSLPNLLIHALWSSDVMVHSSSRQYDNIAGT